MKIISLRTPCLIVDQAIVKRNIDKLKTNLHHQKVRIRPHLKTSKCVNIAKLLVDTNNPGITVSTIREAEYFAEHGFKDILYGVSIVPSKLNRIVDLYRQGIHIQLILDTVSTAQELAKQAAELKIKFKVWIEVDTDGHRAGIEPDDPDLLTIGKILHASPQINLIGVMTHAGDAYECSSIDQIKKHAEQERSRCVAAAEGLRAEGITCKEVSVGSTPTAVCGEHFTGCTEVRAGVFVFFDLFQMGLGVCEFSDIGLSVLSTVISHNYAHNRLIIDAGGLALSKDHGTASQKVDCAYGLVGQAETGELIPGL